MGLDGIAKHAICVQKCFMYQGLRLDLHATAEIFVERLSNLTNNCFYHKIIGYKPTEWHEAMMAETIKSMKPHLKNPGPTSCLQI
jgi:hypothetical protein